MRVGDARARVTYLVFLLVPFALAALIGVYRPFALLALRRAAAGGARRCGRCAAASPGPG